jgi:DNA invertase Pin-like site-specific DNA recombinase
MTKITPEHLGRSAYIYIRQSSTYQVANNLESQRRQYGLVERARQLGWESIEVIDEDLGKSGSGGTERPGFQKLLAAICEGRVGAVLSLEASRLARNGRDWHSLLEFCAVLGTLIVDEDGLYDPRLINDRLLLGMKGTMSEMEVSVFRQRSAEAIKQKARRGELLTTLAVGYVKTDDNRIEKDPDRRVQDAIALVFRKFAELQSIRQVLLWFRDEEVMLPRAIYGGGAPRVTWTLPVYPTLHHMLTNPVYAGVYAFGRRGSRTIIKDGQKRQSRESFKRNWNDWDVLIRDHHPGYVSWGTFEKTQSMIAENANRSGYAGRGAIRKGEALLPGLLRCARCGRRLRVAYTGKGGNTQRYVCHGTFGNSARPNCLAFGGMRIDRAVATEVLGRLQPLGIEAALSAVAAHEEKQHDKLQQMENALQQARFEARRAQRRYDAVDPDNRLVAEELERRWNDTLHQVRDLETDIDRLKAETPVTVSMPDRERLLSLGADLAQAWSSPGVTPETQKRIMRLVIREIIVDTTEDSLALIIHWQGGDHTRLSVKKNKAGHTRWTISGETLDLVRVLARQMPDEHIASILNRAGRMTGKGLTWNRSRVCSLRSRYDIPTYREGERQERGELTLDEAAAILDVSPSTVRRLIGAGDLSADQTCKGAPWIIRQHAVETDSVRKAADARRGRRPAPHDPLQIDMQLQRYT